MTIATTSSTARRSLLQHIPELALALAGTAIVLLALGPIGWRAGWWYFRFSLLTLMPWAAYFGFAAVIVSVLALAIGLSRLDRRGIALTLVALIGGGLIAYVPWHYDQADSAANPRHHVRSGQIRRRLSRSCRCGKAKASIRWPMKAPRLRNSNGKLIRTLSR